MRRVRHPFSQVTELGFLPTYELPPLQSLSQVHHRGMLQHSLSPTWQHLEAL